MAQRIARSHKAKASRTTSLAVQHSLTMYFPPLLYRPTCPETLLAKEFVYAIENACLAGGWLDLVPALIGCDRGVDAAASCFKIALQGAAMQSPSRNIEAACARDYAGAAHTLQLKLRDREHDSSDSALLIATLLFFANWSITQAEGSAKRSAASSAHIHGMNAIMLALHPGTAPSELQRSIYSLNWPAVSKLMDTKVSGIAWLPRGISWTKTCHSLILFHVFYTYADPCVSPCLAVPHTSCPGDSFSI